MSDLVCFTCASSTIRGLNFSLSLASFKTCDTNMILFQMLIHANPSNSKICDFYQIIMTRYNQRDQNIMTILQQQKCAVEQTEKLLTSLLTLNQVQDTIQ